MYIAVHRVHIVFNLNRDVCAVFKNKKIATQYVNRQSNPKEYTVQTFAIKSKAE